MLELDNLRRHMTGLQHEPITPSRKLVHTGVLAVWFDELNRRRNVFFVLLSDMVILAKRKTNEQEISVLDVAFTNEIQACTSIGERILQIRFDRTTLAGCRNILDCELQSVSDRDKWLRLLNKAMTSCAVHDVEAEGGTLTKRSSIRITDVAAPSSPEQFRQASAAGEPVLQALQLAKTWKLVQAGKVKSEVYDQLLALHGNADASSKKASSLTDEDAQRVRATVAKIFRFARKKKSNLAKRWAVAGRAADDTRQTPAGQEHTQQHTRQQTSATSQFASSGRTDSHTCYEHCSVGAKPRAPLREMG